MCHSMNLMCQYQFGFSQRQDWYLLGYIILYHQQRVLLSHVLHPQYH